MDIPFYYILLGTQPWALSGAFSLLHVVCDNSLAVILHYLVQMASCFVGSLCSKIGALAIGSSFDDLDVFV